MINKILTMAKQKFIKASGIIYSSELKTICGVKGNNDGFVRDVDSNRRIALGIGCCFFRFSSYSPCIVIGVWVINFYIVIDGLGGMAHIVIVGV